jgi:hypothetical protein
MINVKFDNKQTSKILNNSVQYSLGFLQGIDNNKIVFNNKLAQYTKEALEKYIDAKARMHKSSLHHVYEWEQTGNPNARLFDIDAVATNTIINFSGKFLPSRSISDDADEPFIDKAKIMENQISIIVEPRSAEALAFEDEGETVFTTATIVIDNPGGDEVAGSFGETVAEFFNIVFTGTFLKQSGILKKLAYPIEYAQNFSAGAKGGTSTGISAGRKYYNIDGLTIQ